MNAPILRPEVNVFLSNGVAPVSGPVFVPSAFSTLVVFVVVAAGAVWAWRCHARALAVGLGAVAVLPAMTLSQQLTWSMVVPVAALAAVGVWWRWSRSESVVTRWGDRSRRRSGVASGLDIARKASPRAMRRQARRVRPSLAGLSWWELYRTPVTEYAVMLCRVGLQQVWSSSQVVVLVFGSPRKGKSAMLAGKVLDAPGAVLVASTKQDLLAATRVLRARRGPVSVFNPSGEGSDDARSTVAFDVLTGCADPVVAAARAGDMIAAGGDLAGGGGGDRDYWDGQARRVLAALMHAAAIGARAMTDVQRWVADPKKSAPELTALLRSSVPAMVADARQFLSTNDRTQTSITSSIMPALAWLTHPAAAASANTDGTSSLPTLHVERLLAERGTIYLLGGEEAPTAPLVCALTGYVAREARRLAALAPGERLDPHLTLVLDEAAQICPVPLDRWSADMGGRGVSIVAGFQSRAQMLGRYGTTRTATTMNNAGGKVLFGGTSDRDDLGWWTTLAGERDEQVSTTDEHGRVSSRSVRKVPVIAAPQLARLADHQVVVFAPGIPPAIGWAERYWRRPDVRAVTHPNSWRVRGRALTAHLLATVTAAVAATLRGMVSGCRAMAAAAIAWMVAQWAQLCDGVADVRYWIAARLTRVDSDVSTPVTGDGFGETGPAVASEPDTGGGEVIVFPAAPWPANIEADRAALLAGDWPSDNGHDNQGRWN
jgi:type IV secretory pathway TraG/TraD family ATPase VirD4